MMHEADLVGKSAGLSQIMGDHDDLGTAMVRLGDQGFHRKGRARIKVGRGLVEKQDLGLDSEGSGQREALLLAAREPSGRPRGLTFEPGHRQRFVQPGSTLASRHAPGGKGEGDVGRHRAPQEDGLLEHHGLTLPNTPVGLGAGPADLAGIGRDEAVKEAEQQAFAGAVGAENDGTRPCSKCEIDAVDQPLPAGVVGEAAHRKRQDRARLDPTLAPVSHSLRATSYPAPPSPRH